MRVFPDLTVDGEFKALGDTGVSGSLNDRQYDYLGNSGYTGALPDRFGEYKGFNPASLFSGASSRGFMFDFRDYNTLFTDTAGTTRVTSTNQAVGLALDKSQGLALGPELVTNGDFSNGTTGWSSQLGATLTAVSGGLRVTGQAATAFSLAFQIVSANLNNALEITWTATVETLGSTNPRVGIGSTVRLFATSGQYRMIVPGGRADNKVDLNPGTDGVVLFDNITVRELAGNHATQGTLGNRPLSVIFPSSGVRNRANGSAAPSDVAIWPASTVRNGITATKVGSGFDTDGLPYVDLRFQGTASGTFHEIAFNYLPTPAASGQSWTCSAIMRVIGGSTANTSGLTVRVQELDAADGFIDNSVSDRVTASVDTISISTNAIATGVKVRALVELAFTTATSIDVTYRIKALQFELGSSRTSYQFNYSAQNVTEPGFASIRGIQFDGVDDWLQTAAIDFSNSDEVTVVAGVRKLSDAAIGVVAELTTNSGGNTGTFCVFAPATVAPNYNFRSRGTVTAETVSPSSFAAPDSAVLTGQGKIGTDTAILRRNGSQVATTATDQGTGNFSNAQVFIGRRGGTSLPFNGVLTFLFAINRLLTANELAAVEAYANGRTGAF